MLKVGGGLVCSSSSSSRNLARAREDPPPAVAVAASGMREDPADLDQTKLAVLGERSEIAGGVMAGLDSSSSSFSAVAGCVTREDAAFNQPKVVQYLELFLLFLLAKKTAIYFPES